MPVINSAAPLTQNRFVSEQGTAAGNARHRVDVGAVVEASTRGSGSVRGDITSAVSTQGIMCVDPAEMLQRLAAPTITGFAQGSNAYSLSAEVSMDIVVDLQAQAEAMARIVGDVVNNRGAVDLECDPATGGTEPVGSTAPMQHG